jgi:glutamate dehydrogenase (NADP+)
MADAVQKEVQRFMRGLRKRNPHEPEFHQAVEEVVHSVMPRYLDNAAYRSAQILERIVEPDRVVIFRVCWEDDTGNVRVNRAWRVQFNKAIGPYKGGLRFDSSVCQSVLKFLAFEQIFKNSLTGLPMGGAKGGANFNPKGKSDREVMRFCQSMMIELHRHIGEDTDVPAGDIGVGAREISYLFGQYTRLENRWTGVLTGKGRAYGGSEIRTEATGYGCVYFCEDALHQHGDAFEGSTVVLSGAGNVARYAAQKALEKGAKVVTLSDSSGFVHIREGLTPEQLQFLHVLKEGQRGRISELADAFPGVQFHADAKPWHVPCKVAMPCATQNELQLEDAQALVNNGVRIVCEGANMPCQKDAVAYFRENEILFAPGKAANAGGVAVSGLEQSQNAMRMNWSSAEVDEKLRLIMRSIHDRCVKFGQRETLVDYVDGANQGGFEKVADAMLAYGVT